MEGAASPRSLPGQATTAGHREVQGGPCVTPRRLGKLRAFRGYRTKSKPRWVGRSVTIDGNTMEHHVAVGLVGMTRTGQCLVAQPPKPNRAEAVQNPRRQLASRKLHRGDGEQDLDTPAGRPIPRAIPAIGRRWANRWCVFYNGGRQGYIGEIETHDDLCSQICREGGLQVVVGGLPDSTPSKKAGRGDEDV